MYGYLYYGMEKNTIAFMVVRGEHIGIALFADLTIRLAEVFEESYRVVPSS